MAELVVNGVQLPTDGSGKITPAFIYTQADGTNVYLPATVLIDGRGQELGGRLLEALHSIEARLARIEELTETSTQVLTS